MGHETIRRRAAQTQDEELFRILLETLPDAVYFKDLDCRFTRVNKAHAQRWGLRPEDFIGKTDFDLFSRESAQAAYQMEQEIIRTGEPVVSFEEHMVTREGADIWWSSTKLAIRDPRGRIIGTFGVSRDITGHRRAEERVVQSEALYHSLVETLPQCIFRKDLDLKLTFGNQRFCQQIGKSLTELVGKGDFDLFPADLAKKYQDDDRRVIKSGKVFEGIEEHKPPGKGTIYVQVVKTPIFDPRGYVIGIEGIFWDVTELTQARKALEDSEQRYALAVAGANDGLWDWDLKGNTIYFGARWKAMLGFAESEIGASPDEWMKRIHPEDREGLKASIAAHLAGRSAHLEAEYRMLHKEKAYRWMLSRGLAVRDAQGKATRLAGSQTDITDRKRAEEELSRQAFYDTLTDLPNRALFIDRLTQAVKRAKRRKDTRFAVLFLDLDRFKDVNDSLGHAIGDELLKAIGKRLEASVRPGDTVARLGGDEFTILLDDLKEPDHAVEVAERIQAELKQPFVLSGQEIFTSVSIGIAPGTVSDEPEDLLRDSDTAMYRAKERGKACYEVFDTTMHSRAVARLKLETDLRKAIERQEFRVFYQPIVSVRSREIVGFEALARWQHPSDGLVPPANFIPLAEETGLIIAMDLWVMRQACVQTKSWQGRWPELSINVNLSSKHFSQPGLVKSVEDVLDDTGLEPGRLRLEITESVILEDVPRIADVLGRLKELGVRLYLDDFGTGYSSLSYLHRFPIDAVKIDRSFVGQLGKKGEKGEKAELVSTITALAANLNMGVVAEGVETEEQLERLRALRCERVQGYFFSKPVDAAAAEILLTRQPNWS
jgi:diguanylate cyclase (GGDEF)-like protein/PAS domain S-box-containing protein